MGPMRRVLTSCGSGLTACIVGLALHRVGMPLSSWAVYDGSWAEWGACQVRAPARGMAAWYDQGAWGGAAWARFPASLRVFRVPCRPARTLRLSSSGPTVVRRWCHQANDRDICREPRYGGKRNAAATLIPKWNAARHSCWTWGVEPLHLGQGIWQQLELKFCWLCWLICRSTWLEDCLYTFSGSANVDLGVFLSGLRLAHYLTLLAPATSKFWQLLLPW